MKGLMQCRAVQSSANALLFCTALIFQGCGSVQATTPRNMICEYVGGVPMDFHRCENSEVVCYTNGDGLSCKWKST